MKDPLEKFATSPGFGISNAADTKAWLFSKYPADLKPFADVIRRSQSFVNKVRGGSNNICVMTLFLLAEVFLWLQILLLGLILV